MPSVSDKQHNLMDAVAHNPAFAREAGIPQKVGAEFVKADAEAGTHRPTAKARLKRREVMPRGKNP